MYSQVNIIAILFLISLFVIVNVIFKNMTNIAVFLVSYVLIDLYMKDKYTSVLFAYVVGISFGIIRNFHLLENFDVENTNEKEVPLKNDQTFKKLNSDPLIKINPDIKSVISDKLLAKFIDKMKEEDDSMVYTRKVFVYDLKPTINELRQGKIKKMKEAKLNTPIILSGDNFILDGHHRWYSRKMKSMAQNNKDKESDDNYINATIINMKVDRLIQRLKDFKEEFNDASFNGFTIDNTKLIEAEKNIKNIKNSINNLDNYMSDLKQLNLV